MRVQKHVFDTDAAVDAAHAHEQTETEEVALVEMTYTVIQPGTVVVHFQNTPAADAAVMSPGRFGDDTLLTDSNSWYITLFLRRETRTRGGGFIVMEEDHEEVPVTVTEVPEDPVKGVRAEDDGQHAQIHDHHDGAGQEDHQRHKHHSKPAAHAVHQPEDGLKHTVQHRVRTGQDVEVEGLQQQPRIAPQIRCSARPLSASQTEL